MNLVKGLFSGKKERAISYKEQGNGYFKSGNYDEAIQYYTSGIELFPVDENEKPAVIIDTNDDKYEDGSENILAVLYSNRSAAYSSVGRLQQALADAELCIYVDKCWAKGYLRKGKALYQLKKFKASAEAYHHACTLETRNRKRDKVKHGIEIEHLKKQNEANNNAYLKLLEEKKGLEYKLNDYSLLFGDAGKKAA